MTADVLLEAAALMRESGDTRDEDVAWRCVADWLDMTAVQVTNYGPNMDSPWTAPHRDMALAVARAYLGTTP